MLEHLLEFTPLHSASLGPDGTRALIAAAAARAEQHGLTWRGPVQLYTEMTILLGIDVDTDPQYPWVAEALRDSSIHQVERADRLHGELMIFLEHAGGPERKFAKRALRRARKLPLEAIPISDADFEDSIIWNLTEIHPEKVHFLGEAAIRSLISRGLAEARRFSIGTSEGVCLLIGLMFSVGHGVANDPKYPWVENTLTNPAIVDAETRIERLYSKTMTYLDQVLENLGEA